MQNAAFRPVEHTPCDGPRGRPTAAQRGPVPSALWRRLRPDLRQAVRDGAFALAFQARRTMANGDICGAEAQLRWPSRHHGVVQASMFLPLAEELGLAGQIVGWTLTSACRAAVEWQEAVLSVSVPARTAQDGSLLTLVADALAATGLAPHRLEIALPDHATEGDCTETLLALSALRDLGLGVALEDFGRAGACLVKLKRLPLTTVKLDRSLLRDMLADRSAASMVRAAIDFAHALDVHVVACGVETETQRAFLRRAGCDAVLERLGTATLDARERPAAA
jgi:EAL domain-containing protein (putative c-di-GMP-specific phosphodiesterase class I)